MSAAPDRSQLGLLPRGDDVDDEPRPAKLYDGPVDLGDIDDDGWPRPRPLSVNPHCCWSKAVCRAMRERRHYCECKTVQRFPEQGVQRGQHDLVSLAWLVAQEVCALSPARQAVLDRIRDDLWWLMRDLRAEVPAPEPPERRPAIPPTLYGYTVVEAHCDECPLRSGCQTLVKDPVKRLGEEPPPRMVVRFCRRRPVRGAP